MRLPAFHPWFLLLCFVAERSTAQQHEYALLQRTDSLVKIGESASALPLLRPLLAKPSDDDSLRAALFMQYANCIEDTDADSGVHYYTEAAVIWERRGDKKNLSRTYANMAMALSVNTNYRTPEKYYGDALANAISKADSLKIYVRLCGMYLQHDSVDMAYRVVQRNILPLSKYGGHDPYTHYFTQLAVGQYFKKRKAFAAALEPLHQAATAPVGNDRYAANAYALLGEAYKELKNYFEASRYADSAYALVGENGWIENRLQIADLYAGINAGTGKWESAYRYSQKARGIYEDIYSENATATLSEKAEKYQNEKLQAQKEAVERNNQRIEAEKKVTQQNLYLVMAALLFAAVLAALFFRNARIRRRANILLTDQKRQVQELADLLAIANDTKARLFSTIGHDLRSPISSLYASLKMQEMAAGGDDTMSEHTVQLLDTLEDLLTWSKSQMDGFVIQNVKVDVSFLLDDLCSFYAASALAKEIVVKNEAKGKVILRTDENLLKTILRNTIANAIEHTPRGNAVRLLAETNDGGVVLSVANPCSLESFHHFKSAYQKAAVQSGAHGLGTVLIKEFAQRIGASVRLYYTDGVAVVSLHFPAAA